jgi:hypothetical protein
MIKLDALTPNRTNFRSRRKGFEALKKLAAEKAKERLPAKPRAIDPKEVIARLKARKEKTT